jgi:GxxExxY protein
MKMASENLLETVIGRAIEVHRVLGPGLTEAVYEAALHAELIGAGIDCVRQVPIDVTYKGQSLGVGFRLDLLVEGCLPLELKAVSTVLGIHKAQLIAYLKVLQLKRGLLLNFNTMLLKVGIRRISI